MRNVTCRSVRWLPAVSRAFSAATTISNESGSARREVSRSTSTAVQPPIETSSSSTGVKSVPSPVPMLIFPPRSLIAVYLLFSMRSSRTLRCAESVIRSTLPHTAARAAAACRRRVPQWPGDGGV